MKENQKFRSGGAVPVTVLKSATASLVRRGGAAKSVSQVKWFIAEVESKGKRR